MANSIVRTPRKAPRIITRIIVTNNVSGMLTLDNGETLRPNQSMPITKITELMRWMIGKKMISVKEEAVK